MVAGKKDFNGESLPYLVLLMSLLRPELQGLKQDQTVPVIPVGGSYNPYNLTGLAFNDYAGYGATNFNSYISPKEATAASNFDPLGQYLNWQPSATSHFNTSAIAMILGEAPSTRLPSGSLLDSESGYSSDEARSPLSAASYRSASPPYSTGSHGFQGNLPDDLSELGATGFTPTDPSLDDLLNSFEDYVDLESLPLLEPNKGAIDNPELSQFDLTSIKQEPDFTYNKLSPQFPGLSMGKTSVEDIDFNGPLPLDLEMDAKYFDPYSIDFATNHSSQFPPLPGSNLEAPIDIDSLVDIDLPPEIFSPVDVDASSKPFQLPVALSTGQNSGRNDSGFPSNGPSTLALTRNIRAADIDSLLPLNTAVRSVPNQNGASSSHVKQSTTTTASKGKKSTTVKRLYGARSKALDSGLPSLEVSDETIVNMPVNEFTVFLEKLPDAQAQYVRDVRRRGKNKEAARICRKRKMDAIDYIDDEVVELKRQKQKILDERKELQEETAELKTKINELESCVFSSLRDDNGHPLSTVDYTLLQGSDGTVFLGKNIAVKEENDNKSS